VSEANVIPFNASAPHYSGAPASTPTPGIQSWRTQYLGYAAIWNRMGAYLIDTIFIMFVAVLTMRVLEAAAPQFLAWLSSRSAFPGRNSIGPIVAFVYFFGLELTGATPGKRLLRLRVIRQDGEQMTVWASLIRNILRPVDLLFFGVVGIISMSTTEQRQRLGDRAAHTIVVQLPPR
jgi:uncharacterized RDD family membrane protein YckC